MRADEGFVAMYESEFPAVVRAAYLLGGDRAAAEDAAQEAFARALERWRRLRDQPWAAGWVMTTALNLVRRSLRRRPAPPAAEASPPGPEAGIDVWRAIGRLPRRQREAIVLHHIRDLSLTDTARAMGVAEGTAKAHLFRARTALAESLRERTP